LGCAQTGTGKTAAFAIPMLQLLHEKHINTKATKNIKALILTPTRELAIQIEESFKAYGRYLNLRHLVIFGGVNQHSQVEALKKGIDILVATPGRLLDLMNQGFINLNTIELFVLDEADRMLDMGFIHDVKRVVAKLPAKRQTLFFSATMPDEIQKLANTILSNPTKVEVTPISSTAETIVQDLGFAGIKAAAIHGNKSQNARQRALTDFKDRKIRVLVATDIAARGIDIDQLSHVFNFELPNIPESYVHRIGRTGRAGANGIAISFCDAEENEYLLDIQKLIKITLPVVDDHPYPLSWENMMAKNQVKRKPQAQSKGGGGAKKSGDGNMSGKPRNASNNRKFGGNRKRGER
jgi:ATP-dependent RNA helicase RhlE